MSQALALFVKATRKIVKRLQDIQKAAISEEMDRGGEAAASTSQTRGLQNSKPRTDDGEEGSEDEEANEGTKTTGQRPEKKVVGETPEQRAFREKQRELISSLDLSKYVHIPIYSHFSAEPGFARATIK